MTGQFHPTSILPSALSNSHQLPWSAPTLAEPCLSLLSKGKFDIPSSGEKAVKKDQLFLLNLTDGVTRLTNSILGFLFLKMGKYMLNQSWPGKSTSYGHNNCKPDRYKNGHFILTHEERRQASLKMYPFFRGQS